MVYSYFARATIRFQGMLGKHSFFKEASGRVSGGIWKDVRKILEGFSQRGLRGSLLYFSCHLWVVASAVAAAEKLQHLHVTDS